MYIMIDNSSVQAPITPRTLGSPPPEVCHSGSLWSRKKNRAALPRFFFFFFFLPCDPRGTADPVVCSRLPRTYGLPSTPACDSPNESKNGDFRAFEGSGPALRLTLGRRWTCAVAFGGSCFGKRLFRSVFRLMAPNLSQENELREPPGRTCPAVIS